MKVNTQLIAAALVFILAGLVLSVITLLSACSESTFVGQALPAIQPDFVTDKADWTGKPLLLEFWATWCPPCRHSIVHLNTIYGKYGPRGLVVLGISDEKRDVVEKAVGDLDMHYSVACDPDGKIARQFHIYGIPHAFLVDKTGKIVWEGHPASLTDKQIEDAMQ